MEYRFAAICRSLRAATHGLEPWVLQPPFVNLQIAVIERASWGENGEPFITALLACDPALLGTGAPPQASALKFALRLRPRAAVGRACSDGPEVDDIERDFHPTVHKRAGHEA